MASWRLAAYRAARPVLFLADPERIHHLALRSLAFVGGNRIGRSHCALISGVGAPDASPVDLMGVRFRNRVGLGAGFDKDGADALARRIADARPHLPPGFVVGVNIGRNRDGDASDYPSAAAAVADVADYLAINVSSPNTPGLRDLQDPARLVPLLAAVADAAPGRPLLVKLSSDLEEGVRRALLTAVDGSTAAAGVIL